MPADRTPDIISSRAAVLRVVITASAVVVLAALQPGERSYIEGLALWCALAAVVRAGNAVVLGERASPGALGRWDEAAFFAFAANLLALLS